METLQRDTLKNMLDHNENVRLINVLGPRDFEQAHIPGSYIPVSDKNFIQEVQKAVGGKDTNIIVYCANFDCTASPDAAKNWKMSDTQTSPITRAVLKTG
jgi:rhodanese-related sulfurtransferase